MDHPKLEVGMKFASVHIFREALREYTISNSIRLHFKRNERKKISVHCKEKCGWRIYASQNRNEKTFQIKSVNGECTCARTFENNSVTSKWIANKFIDEFS